MMDTKNSKCVECALYGSLPLVSGESLKNVTSTSRIGEFVSFLCAICAEESHYDEIFEYTLLDAGIGIFPLSSLFPLSFLSHFLTFSFYFLFSYMILTFTFLFLENGTYKEMRLCMPLNEQMMPTDTLWTLINSSPTLDKLECRTCQYNKVSFKT